MLLQFKMRKCGWPFSFCETNATDTTDRQKEDSLTQSRPLTINILLQSVSLSLLTKTNHYIKSRITLNKNFSL